jgi:pimeloyl-ACP methyl ester carboxylesterase
MWRRRGTSQVLSGRRRWRSGAAIALLLLAPTACSVGKDASGRSAGDVDQVTETPSTPPPTTTGRSSTTRHEPTTDPAPAVPVGTYAVGEAHLTFVDRTRDTAANGEAKASKGRKLPTIVWYPSGSTPAKDPKAPLVQRDAAPRAGHYPLVVFGHGVTATADLYASSLAAFASAGYVVVAPDFPLSSAASPGGPTISDVGNQPGDMSFLIDRFTGVPLATASGSAPDGLGRLAELVDKERIATGGHSLGAITALGAGYASCCVDDRVDTVFDWAGGLYPLLGKSSPDTSVTYRPLLIIHGDEDEVVPYAKGTEAFRKIRSARWFITLKEGGHVPAFLAGFAQTHSALVIRTTLDFLDAQLKGRADGIDDLKAAVKAAGPDQATLRTADT